MGSKYLEMCVKGQITYISKWNEYPKDERWYDEDDR